MIRLVAIAIACAAASACARPEQASTPPRAEPRPAAPTRPPAAAPVVATPAEVATPSPSPTVAASSAPVASASPPQSTDPAGIIAPEPDRAVASLPVDVRVADWTALLEHHRKDCSGFPADPCELVADFDRDGKKDRAIKISDDEGRAGIAVRWASGEVSILGAGATTRQLATEVYVDGIELAWTEGETDLSGIVRWAITRSTATGFVVRPPAAALSKRQERAMKRRKKPPTKPKLRTFRAPATTGAGLWLDGGDAVEIVYWDGARWRRLIVGF